MALREYNLYVIENQQKISCITADLLMITELCRVQTEAKKLAFQEFSYEDYTFICNGGACKECETLNGKHFKVKDMQAG